MASPTSPGLAICTITLLVFDVITWVLRFYVRISKRAWGPDDWSMLVAIPIYTVTTVAMLGLAFDGGGLRDSQLTTERQESAMLWWFIMQTMWCLAAVPVKWAICFTLLRISNRQRKFAIPIYCSMAAVFLVMVSTTIYEFFHCDPLAMNWKPTKINGGHCKAQSNITGFSFALSAVSIVTDWLCALLPIPLLWNIQMDKRIKISVMALLGLGIFTSIAPLVRLSITVNLSSTQDFLFHSMNVAAWAQAELGLGVLVGNLPALRPLLEKLLAMRSTIRSDPKVSGPQKSADRYLELEEGHPGRSQHTRGMSNKGNETRIYGGITFANDNSSSDDQSQKHIIPPTKTHNDTLNSGIKVGHEVEVRIDRSPNPKPNDYKSFTFFNDQ